MFQYGFKAQNSVYLGRKNTILPFEDTQKLEWLSKKHDASLFAVATKSKKRPDNIIIGELCLFQHLSKNQAYKYGIYDDKSSMKYSHAMILQVYSYTRSHNYFSKKCLPQLLTSILLDCAWEIAHYHNRPHHCMKFSKL